MRDLWGRTQFSWGLSRTDRMCHLVAGVPNVVGGAGQGRGCDEPET